MYQYEINKLTMAIVACSKNVSKVYETDQIFYIKCNATKIMEDSCEYFGSSLDGRRKGTTALIGVNYKAPVIVEESNEIIFFPTNSLKNPCNTWISLKFIDSYRREGKRVVIRFKNGKKIQLKVTYGIIDNQVLRSTRLESALRSRKRDKKPTNRTRFVI